MSKKWYGSVNNRIEEGKQFTPEIKVGTGMTEYMWSDRHAYEVTRVIDQEHLFVRKMNAKRIDHNGMSECQDYEYTSNPNAPEIEIVKRRGKWYIQNNFNKDELMKRIDKAFEEGKSNCKTKECELAYYLIHADLTPKQREAFDNGKTVKKYREWNNISFGVMEEYYDFSF